MKKLTSFEVLKKVPLSRRRNQSYYSDDYSDNYSNKVTPTLIIGIIIVIIIGLYYLSKWFILSYLT